MMAERTIWTGNEHIRLVDLKVGDRAGTIPVEVKACPVRYGQPQWNVLVVNPNSEAATADRLRDASIRVYWPKVYVWVATKTLLANGQKKMVKAPRPMFPGYLFVDLRRGLDDFRAPLVVKGVRDYLWRDVEDEHGRPDRLPYVLPHDLYLALIEREGERSRAADQEKRFPFQVGQAVRIIDGPFKDFVATVEALDDRGRVDVLMAIFARETPMRLNAQQLEKV